MTHTQTYIIYIYTLRVTELMTIYCLNAIVHSSVLYYYWNAQINGILFIRQAVISNNFMTSPVELATTHFSNRPPCKPTPFFNEQSRLKLYGIYLK